MSVFEVAIWSACLGVYFSYALLSFFFAAAYRRPQVLNIAAVIALTFGAIFLASGMGQIVWPELSPKTLSISLLLIMPISACASTLGLRSFLRAEYRDPLISWGMSTLALVSALAVLAALWPDQTLAIEVQAVVVIWVAFLSCWLTLRAWLAGDSFALPMLVACIVLVFAISGLYAQALQMQIMTPSMQAFTAFLCAAYVVISFQVLRRRHATKVQMKQSLAMSNDKDLLTQLWTGTALIRKIDDAVLRAKRQRKELTVIGIDFSNANSAKQTHNSQGLEQVVYSMAMRINHLCSNDLVGRYGTHGFVVVIDRVRNRRMLRSLGLRMAVNLRRPYLIDPDDKGELFNAEIGIGIARLSGKWGEQAQQNASETQLSRYDTLSAAQDILHEAFELAQDARAFRSRVALRSEATSEAIALESFKFR